MVPARILTALFVLQRSTCMESRSASCTSSAATWTPYDTMSGSQMIYSRDSNGTIMAPAATRYRIGHGRSWCRWSSRLRKKPSLLKSTLSRDRDVHSRHDTSDVLIRGPRRFERAASSRRSYASKAWNAASCRSTGKANRTWQLLDQLPFHCGLQQHAQCGQHVVHRLR
jgi:hypothetical protein